MGSSAPIESTRPGPEVPAALQELQNMTPTQLEFLLRIQKAMGMIDEVPTRLPSTSAPVSGGNPPSSTTPVIPPTLINEDDLTTAVRLKVKSLPPNLRDKFLVHNLNLNTRKTTISEILEMILIFAPSAKPTGKGYIKKEMYIAAYQSAVEPLLSPHLPPRVDDEATSGTHYRGYPWEYYLTPAFDPSSRKATIEVLTGLMKYFAPWASCPTTRSALEAAFRLHVCSHRASETPPPYSDHLAVCAAPFHAKLSADHLRFTLQLNYPTLLIPAAAPKATLVALYEVHMHQRKAMPDDPVCGIDYFIGTSA